MWINRLAKLYIGISISGALLALGLLVYSLFQNDVVVLVLSFIVLCIFMFVTFIDIQAVRSAQRGKIGLAIAVVLFWAFTIVATLTSSDYQWQSRLLYYAFDAVTIVKIVALVILIKNKGSIENKV